MSQSSDKASEIALARVARAALDLTYKQIDAAVRMWRDPQNWLLTPCHGTTRTLYRRVKNGP
jgi:hypothetical protein